MRAVTDLQPAQPPQWFCFFFFNDTATTEIYTLSLHDALPISRFTHDTCHAPAASVPVNNTAPFSFTDRKSTRLNSSHLVISYAVFCLKKKTSSRRRPSPPTLSCC